MLKTFLLFLIKLHFFVFCIFNISFGQEFIVSESKILPYNLSSEVSLFEDSTAKLSFDQVKNKKFKKNTANRVLLPFANQSTWLKIKLKNNTSADSTWYFLLDNPVIRKTTLYTDNQQDSISFETFKIREVGKLKSPHFRINLKQGESKNFYLKLETQRGIYFVLQLYDSKGFEKLSDSNKIALGFMSGLTWMVIFIVFSIGFLVVKDSKSRAYAIYTFIRAIGFWSSTNILGNLVTSNPMGAEMITFALMGIYPLISAFLALNILPFDKLPRWTKVTTYGFLCANLLVFICLIAFYGPLALKSLVVLTIISHLFFYSLFIFTLAKKINEYPYYSIPFLLGNLGNLTLNARVLGIIHFDSLIQFTVLLALLEIAIYVYYLSHIFRISVKNQAEKLRNLGFEAEKATKLEELDKLKTRFFTNISHEFRTPLTLLVGPIEDLQQKYPQEGIIKVMQRNLQRLQNLINQLLDIAKLEAGEMKLNLQEVDVAKYLDHLFSSFESLAQSKSILFNHSQSHLSYFGVFDTDKLEKIIVNLLSNAFKFTPKNGRISVRIEYTEKLILVNVQDYGIGIPPERLPHIFDRFYQVEEHKSYEGTGIGLALVKELVDLLGGKIEVQSELGKGTAFTLNLPFKSLEKLSNPAVQFEHKINLIENVIESNISNETNIENETQTIILIVEDNTDLRNYIASIFENQYQLVLAVDGEDGLIKAIEHIPDLVISDLMMPKLDGLGFCEKLKNDERINHIPVVMLTAKASLADRLAGLEHGADDYLSKPFNKEELQIRVNNLISQRRILREKYSNQNIVFTQKIEETIELTIDELFVEKVKKVIDKHLDQSEFDVEKLADELNLTISQLRRKLKAITDQTVTEFVRNYRLELAAQMLKKGENTVSEIAYKVGFESLSYFSKMFLEKYGKTASEWK